MAKAAVYVGKEIGDYGFGGGHPFGPHRMDAFWSEAKIQGLDRRASVQKPVLAGRDLLEKFHTRGYVSLVEERSRTGDGYLDYGDTPAFPGIFEAASYVVGCTVDATRRIMAGEFPSAFIPIAGLHHARRDSAGGFCVFNDVGVAIHCLRDEFNIRRIAYIDIDAHHGDGVFYGFESDPNVLIVDLHQDGHTLYPGTGHAYETGKGAAEGTKMNLPLPPGTGDTLFFQAWPKVAQFLMDGKPEFIFFQCGADSIAGDPITNMRLSPTAHYHVALRLAQIADSLGHGRIVGVGGGGYNSVNIGHGWCGVLRAFIENAESGKGG